MKDMDKENVILGVRVIRRVLVYYYPKKKI